MKSIFECSICKSKKVSELKPINENEFKVDEVNYFCWECWGLTTLKIVDEVKGDK